MNRYLLLLILMVMPSLAVGDIYHCRIDGKDWFLNYPCPKKSKKMGVVMKTPNTPLNSSGSIGDGSGNATAAGNTPADSPLPGRSWSAGRAQAPSWRPVGSGSRRVSDPRTEIDRIIKEASRTYTIPEPLIRAVITVESNFSPTVVSNKGAMGLMQLMPSVVSDYDVSDPYDPYQNIMAGVSLLRTLANRFNGDIPKVLAAYHSGGGSVSKRAGIAFQGSDGYVRKVLDHYYRIKNAREAPAIQ